MNFKLKIITVIIGIALISCKKDKCGDAMFPKQHFDSESLTFQPWVTISGFVYKDSLGQEFSYDASTFVELDHPNLLIIPCGNDSSLLAYESENYLKRFTGSNNTSIVFVHSVVFSEDESVYRESNLIDQMGVSVYNDNLTSSAPISQIRLITAARESSADVEAYNSTYTIVHDSLVFLDKVFYEVFEQKTGNPKLYFTKNEGIVAFTDNAGTKLVLERIE